MPSPLELFADAQRRDTRALGRALSVLEDDTADARALDQLVLGAIGNGVVLGVTGAPGAGKSSLVDALLPHAADIGPVAVVAVDPTSPFSGGAILGDRVRMHTDGFTNEVFVRSLASRGSGGGLSMAARRSIRLFLSCGFSTVFVETVGVGQIELDIAQAADVVSVVLTANSGDEVQAAKAGILEIADIFVVNKCDLAGSETVVRNLSYELSLVHGDTTPPIVSTSTNDGTGVEDLWSTLATQCAALRDSGALIQRRAAQRENEMLLWVSKLIHERLEHRVPSALADQVRNGSLDPASAAESFVAELLQEKS